MLVTDTKKAKPFLKWAGGKTQLLPKIKEFMPKEVTSGKVKYYVEPFVGSGAVLFELIQSDEYRFEKAYIWDINPELINVYKIIKSDNVKKLVVLLREKEIEYNTNEDKEVRKAIYMRIRGKFNNDLATFEGKPTSDFLTERASEFIFLNRTCFNGLYRVNRSGQFNVPMGDYKKPTICDEENLLAVHQVLQNVEIAEPGDYRNSLSTIEEIISSGQKVFVYFDSPYRPLNASSSFTSYSKYDFNDDSQRELADYFKKLDELGAYLMLSNSDPKNEDEDDNFFDDLFFKEGNEGENQFTINRVFARRNINSKAEKRGQITELLITN
jgi:DNA adenine methylase